MYGKPVNYGEWLGRWADIDASEAIGHQDVSAWGAPSECHGDVARSYKRSREELDLEMGATINMNFEQLMKAVGAEGVDCYKAFHKCVDKIYERDNPFLY
jgi:protein-arginine kinase activator protein McsA